MSLGPNQLGKDPPSSGPFTVVATIRAKSDSDVSTLQQQIGNIVKHANSSKEPDCTTYILNQAVDDKKFFVVYEEYKDAAAFKTHCDAEPFQTFAAGIKDTTEFVHLRYLQHAA